MVIDKTAISYSAIQYLNLFAKHFLILLYIITGLKGFILQVGIYLFNLSPNPIHSFDQSAQVKGNVKYKNQQEQKQNRNG
jgi:hypothetical protein